MFISYSYLYLKVTTVASLLFTDLTLQVCKTSGFCLQGDVNIGEEIQVYRFRVTFMSPVDNLFSFH